MSKIVLECRSCKSKNVLVFKKHTVQTDVFMEDNGIKTVIIQEHPDGTPFGEYLEREVLIAKCSRCLSSAEVHPEKYVFSEREEIETSDLETAFKVMLS